MLNEGMGCAVHTISHVFVRHSIPAKIGTLGTQQANITWSKTELQNYE